MHDVLTGAWQKLGSLCNRNSVLVIKPIAADPWITSSILQKSIRRGETVLAQRAALTLFEQRGSAIWRRLIVIAFEDVGIGNVDALATVIGVASDRAWRTRHGGDLRLAIVLARVLAAAPKDRSADYVWSKKSPDARELRAENGK